LRMGGLHWGTEFRTRPDVITFPLPAVRGEAVVPSTADVYVNGVLRSRSKVAPGPFTLHDLPVISGSGDLRLVVRDSLGREQVVTQPYLVNEGLLRPGLSSYSVDVGAIREDYGLESFQYGRPIAVIDVRRGVSDWITIEGNAERAQDQQTFGFGLTGALHPVVLLSAAISHSEAEQSGDYAQLGISTTGRALNAGIRLRVASEGFRQVGMPNGEPIASRSIDGQIGWQAGRFGSVGLVFARRDHRNDSKLQMLSATYGVALGPVGYLSAFATRSLSEEESLQVALMLTRALGNRTAARVAASVDDRGLGGGTSVSRSLPANEGSGFHFETERGASPRMGAGYAAQNSAITVTLDGQQRSDRSRFGMGARGGLVVIGGHASAVRDPGDDMGIALVEVPGQPGVTIYHDNHRAARTDSHGFAMVTGLRPYEVNRLRIDTEDLPIDVALTNEEIRVRPYSGGGVQIRFPEAQTGGATMRLLRPSGEPVPAGATAHVGEREFTVAGSGILYVTGVSGSLSIKVTWARGGCYAQARVPVGSVLPDLGTVMCGEII
jgi:outer membrane usher protein